MRWWACGGCSACFAHASLATPGPRLPAQVRELLANGANTEAVDKNGETALHHAAARGHDAVVRERPGPGGRRATGIQLRVRALNDLAGVRRV